MTQLEKKEEFTLLDPSRNIDEENIPIEGFEVGEAHLPPSAHLENLEETFGTNLTSSPASVRDKVREMFVPLVLATYRDLLTDSNPKLRLDAANKLMEVADITGHGGGTGGGAGALINFNLGGDGKTNLFGALGELGKGEVLEAEVVEDD